MALKVIIAAGGELPRDMRDAGHPANKTLLAVGGATLLERALAAARGLAGIRPADIAVAGDADVRAALPADVAWLETGRSVVDNIERGFSHHGGREHDYLVLSSDLPFVTPGKLAQFMALAPAAGELAVPVVTRERFLARFPGAPNKFELVDRREITLGSAFYLTGPLLHSNIPLMRDFAKYRKTPYKLALLLGFEVLLGFLFRRISLSTLERRASAITGGRARAVELDAAELAYDIDTAAEYEFALAHAKASSSPSRP